MVSAGLGENCNARTVMSHTARGGQASDQDSNSGPGRHRQPSGQVGRIAPIETTGQDQNWVTLDHLHQHWPTSANRQGNTHRSEQQPADCLQPVRKRHIGARSGVREHAFARTSRRLCQGPSPRVSLIPTRARHISQREKYCAARNPTPTSTMIAVSLNGRSSGRPTESFCGS